MKLPPEMQVALVAQLVGVVFSCGVLWANIRFLSKRVKELGERQDDHDKRLESQGERIVRVETTVEGMRR